VGVLDGEMMNMSLSKAHCPFCLTKLYECHSSAFTRELQDLVAQNACQEKKAWAQLILAFEHLGMIRRQNESPGDNLIVGGVRDVQRGIELLRLSAKQGHPQAMFPLALKYYHGISGLEKSIEKAIPLLESSLIQGHAISGAILYGIYERQGSLKKAISCWNSRQISVKATRATWLGMHMKKVPTA
jgi:TPR repeat protein